MPLGLVLCVCVWIHVHRTKTIFYDIDECINRQTPCIFDNAQIFFIIFFGDPKQGTHNYLHTFNIYDGISFVVRCSVCISLFTGERIIYGLKSRKLFLNDMHTKNMYECLSCRILNEIWHSVSDGTPVSDVCVRFDRWCKCYFATLAQYQQIVISKIPLRNRNKNNNQRRLRRRRNEVTQIRMIFVSLKK